jgi:hypothetical protein
MNKLRILLSAGLIGLCSFAGGLMMNTHQAIAENPNTVQIVGPLPLPVAGSVSGNVSINNPAASPVLVRDVDDPARHAFQITLCFKSVTWTGGPCAADDHFTVPTGKHFVIEYVSGFCNSGLDSVGRINVSTYVNNVQASHFLNDPTPFHSPIYGGLLEDFGQQVRIYADGGRDVSAGVNFPGESICYVTLSGYML